MNEAIPSKKSFELFKGWQLFFLGICMGIADLIPGISGGTIAFILGFYQPLLESLQTINSTTFRLLLQGNWTLIKKQVAWQFLLPLFIGVICAILGFAHFLHFILAQEVYRTYLYAVFLGLIGGSLFLCLWQISVWNLKVILALFFGTMVAHQMTFTAITPSTSQTVAVVIPHLYSQKNIRNYDQEKQLLTHLSPEMLGALVSQNIITLDDSIYTNNHVLLGKVHEYMRPYSFSLFNPWLIFCGMAAVCALLLPGLSGSYLLHFLGIYPFVLEALLDCIQGIKQLYFPAESLILLGNLSIGIAMGGFGFAHFLNWLLKNHFNMTMATLSGFLIGTWQSVWPFWSYEYILFPLKLEKDPQLIPQSPFLPHLNSIIFWQALCCTILSALFILMIHILTNKRTRIYN